MLFENEKKMVELLGEPKSSPKHFIEERKKGITSTLATPYEAFRGTPGDTQQKLHIFELGINVSPLHKGTATVVFMVEIFTFIDQKKYEFFMWTHRLQRKKGVFFSLNLVRMFFFK